MEAVVKVRLKAYVLVTAGDGMRHQQLARQLWSVGVFRALFVAAQPHAVRLRVLTTSSKPSSRAPLLHIAIRLNVC